MELLRRLHLKPRHVFTQKVWDRLVGDLDSAVAELQDSLLIEPASFKEVVTVSLTVPELKRELRVRGLRISGSKPELVERLVNAVDEATLRSALRLAIVFRHTSEGARVLDGYRAERASSRSALEHECLSRLRKKDIDGAWKLIEVENRSIFERDFGYFGYSEMIQPNRDVPKLISAENLPDIDVDAQVREEIAVHLVYGRMVLEDIEMMAERVIRLVGVPFPATGVRNDLALNGSSPTDKDMAVLFVRSVSAGVAHRGKMQRYHEHGLESSAQDDRRSNAGLLGVEILTAGDGRVCAECRLLDGKQYRNTDDVPQLPIHPGCRCTTIPWLAEL